MLLNSKFCVSETALGTPEDNAFVESFFKTMKREKVYFKPSKKMKELLLQVPTFIDEVDNRKRFKT